MVEKIGALHEEESETVGQRRRADGQIDAQLSARRLPAQDLGLRTLFGRRVGKVLVDLVAGKLIAYSGDARWSDELVEVAKGADLFICEATNFSKSDAAHISYRELMANRSKLDCGRIILTHLGADSIAHLSEMELERAEDGMQLTL